MIFMNTNKVTVEIFGETHALKGDMDSERVKRLAKIVDAEMRDIAQGNGRLPTAKIAILAAMNLADEYLKLEADYRQLLAMVKNE